MKPHELTSAQRTKIMMDQDRRRRALGEPDEDDCNETEQESRERRGECDCS